MRFYVQIDDEEKGPFSGKQLKKLAESGHLTRHDSVRKEDSKRWFPASNVKGLFKDVPESESKTVSSPPPIPPSRFEPESNSSSAPPPPLRHKGGKESKSALARLKIPIIVFCTVLLVVFGGLLIAFSSESPEDAYREIVARADAGDWEYVWDRIDQKSQVRMEIALEMLANMAAAFGGGDEELQELSGKELFLRMAKNNQDIRQQYTNRTVESSIVEGERATLTVWQEDQDGNKTKGTVKMIHEDGVWKISIDQEDVKSSDAESDQPFPSFRTVERSKSSQTSSTPAEISNPDFRNTKWGMSMQQVKRQEEAELVSENETILGYRATLNGLDCLIGYIFAQGKLVRATYLIDAEHSNKNDHIKDYSGLKSLLVQKYGSPSEDEVVWRDDLYRDTSSDWGMAISVGHLIFYSKWETRTSTVFLGLSGENFEIKHAVEYKSKQFGHLEDEAKKRKSLEDL